MAATAGTLVREAPVAAENRLLAALSRDDYQRLRGDLEPIRLNPNEVIYECGEAVRYIYFPRNSAASMLTLLEDGTTVEVGIIGNSGMFGVPTILGANKAQNWTVTQIPGEAVRMEADVLKERFDECPSLHLLLTRFYRSLVAQFCQRAACNCRHLIMQRLCTWLLMAQDSVADGGLPFTQDLISQRLGSRRASVTEAFNRMQEMGVVCCSRGRVVILSRRGLEALACECYQIIRQESERVFRA